MPWFDCYVLHVKLMLITGRIGRYIQISWDPFVHLETSCAAAATRAMRNRHVMLYDIKWPWRSFDLKFEFSNHDHPGIHVHIASNSL